MNGLRVYVCVRVADNNTSNCDVHSHNKIHFYYWFLSFSFSVSFCPDLLFKIIFEKTFMMKGFVLSRNHLFPHKGTWSVPINPRQHSTSESDCLLPGGGENETKC